MIFYLHPKLQQFFQKNKSLFTQLMDLRGKVYRKQAGRETQQIILGNKRYFIKQYRGLSVREFLKNIIKLRKPIFSAQTEWRALKRLKALHVRVAQLLAYGIRFAYTPWQESFILMEDLEPAISLETLCRQWQYTPPSFVLKQLLLKEVAHIASLLHDHGINHRDFYLCHFLLDKSSLGWDVQKKKIKLFLIDLHRTTVRQHSLVPKRWIIKDLAGLYFSSQSIGLNQRDFYRFIEFYRKKKLRTVLKEEFKFWENVKIRGHQLYAQHRTHSSS